jgi:carbon-monoxide dehydrogenase small subunit
MVKIELKVNGESHGLEAAPDLTLLDALREELRATGTKRGCDIAACGACTVIVDGEAILSCMTQAVRCEGKEITTVEGLAQGGRLHPLQESAIEHGAVQCGYCTPGWLMSAKALIDRNPRPTREEVTEALSGNFCRCTGYKKIIESVLAVGASSAAAE